MAHRHREDILRQVMVMDEKGSKAATIDDLPTDEKLSYHAVLSTLVRRKRKQRVPPPGNHRLFDCDKIKDDLLPKSYGHKLDPDHPPPAPYGCELEKCETCYTQTFPARIGLTDAEAITRVQDLTSTINEDLAHLRSVLGSHADYIAAKWKKSKVRGEVLAAINVSSEPGDHKTGHVGLYDKKWAAIHLIDMRSQDSLSHQDTKEMFKGTGVADDPWTAALAPHVLNFLSRQGEQGMAEKFQTTYLLPYLDLQSLEKDPLLFLSLLHARTAHSPEEWMMFDNSQVKLAEHWEIIIGEFNEHFVTMTGEQYGREIAAWDKTRVHRWESIGFLKAVYILTAQRHMMTFLRSAVDNLLGQRATESGLEVKPQPKWKALVGNGLFNFGNSSAVSLRAYANQPFSAPPKFDPAKTFELVQSMYEASIDELDLAQTSPAYVQCLVHGFESSVYSTTHGDRGKWGVVVDELICNLFRRYIWWRQMYKEARMMLDSYERYQKDPSKENRKAFESGAALVYDISSEHLTQQILLLQYSLPFQRGFERNFEYKRTVDSDKSVHMVVHDEDAFHNDTLFWSLRAFGYDRDRVFTMDPSFNIRVLDDILSHAKSQERSRVSDQLLRSISEMAVVDEIRTSIECDRSWDHEPSKKSVPMLPFRKEFISKYCQTLSLPEIIESGGLADTMRAFCKESRWPTGRVDSTWLTAATNARERLDAVWGRFRHALKRFQLEKEFPTSFIVQDWAALSAASRPVNVAAVEQEAQDVRNRIKARTKTPTASSKSKTYDWEIDWSVEEPEKFIAPTPKRKKKTRPSESTDTHLEDASDIAISSLSLDTDRSTTPPNLAPVSLKPENVGLFEAMFTMPKAQARSYSWVHFTQAMVDAGCSITQGSGSAVHFRSAQGVIVFHRPHPEPTIDPVILIAMGQRLKKRFGWSVEMFSLGT